MSSSNTVSETALGANTAPKKALRPQEEVQTEHQKQVETVGEIRQKEAKVEDRPRALQDLVAEDWELLEDGSVLCYGATIPEHSFPDIIAQKLQWYEQKHGVTLSAETSEQKLGEAIAEALTYTEPPKGNEVYSPVPEAVQAWVNANCPDNLRDNVCNKYQTMAAQHPEISEYPVEQLLPSLVENAAKTAQREANASEIATRTDRVENKTSENADKRATLEGVTTTGDVLSDLKKVTAGMSGRKQLKTVMDYLDAIDPKTKNENAETPEVVRQLRGRFSQIAATLDEMSNVGFTDAASRDAFEAIIANTSLDLGADNLAATLAPVMAQVEASDKFSQADKQKLRDVVTGSDAQAVMGETVTDENGVTRPRYSQKHQREFRSGVSGYATENNRQIVEGRAGDHLVTKDVTGWSGEDVGALIETMHMWNTLESFGSTGFVENIYKIDFSILGDGQAFDPLQIIRMRQVLSHLVGGFEGYDGDIANLEDKKTLLHNQARLMSETQTAFGFENDQAGTTRVLQRLGMQDSNGKPNMDVIKAFGSYTQENYGGGDPDQLQLVNHLNKHYPQFVAPLTEAERRGGKLKMGNKGQT